MNHQSHTYIILIIATVLISLVQSRVLEPNDMALVTSTCNRTPYPTICIQLIEEDPRSANVDVSGLALIVIDFIKTRSDDTMNKINRLLVGPDLGNKNALSDCAKRYNEILASDVPEAIAQLKIDNARNALNALGDAFIEVTTCEEDFNGSSPLTKENKDVHVVIDITRAIVGLLT